jgi:hypothetical protein
MPDFFYGDECALKLSQTNGGDAAIAGNIGTK